MARKLSAREASLITKEYFEKTQGAIFLFEIENVDFEEKEKMWLVECSFFPSAGATKKAYYKVKVSDETSKIFDIKRLSKNV